ncbi:hypothetical protein GN956_G7354 [Arapaima gigas]
MATTCHDEGTSGNPIAEIVQATPPPDGLQEDPPSGSSSFPSIHYCTHFWETGPARASHQQSVNTKAINQL